MIASRVKDNYLTVVKEREMLCELDDPADLIKKEL